MNKIRVSGAVWIASDIHLGPQSPLTCEAFFRFLEDARGRADALILCGDIFDAWIGDDLALRDPPPWLEGAVARLKAVAADTPLWLGRGNRDFLIGPELATYLGARLLPDTCRLATDWGDILLSHGDEYCIDDHAYQRFRRIVRTPLVQGMFLSLGLRTRRRIAAWARRRSMAANRGKPADIMDVSEQAVIDAFRQSGMATMVHGHTHRPAVHTLMVGTQARTRIVLPDWHYEGAVTRGGWLVVDRNGPRLVESPPLPAGAARDPEPAVNPPSLP